MSSFVGSGDGGCPCPSARQPLAIGGPSAAFGRSPLPVLPGHRAIGASGRCAVRGAGEGRVEHSARRGGLGLLAGRRPDPVCPAAPAAMQNNILFSAPPRPDTFTSLSSSSCLSFRPLSRAVRPSPAPLHCGGGPRPGPGRTQIRKSGVATPRPAPPEAMQPQDFIEFGPRGHRGYGHSRAGRAASVPPPPGPCLTDHVKSLWGP